MTESQRLQVRVFQDLEELSRAAAELFTALSKKSIASRGRFVVALSGGSTPHLLYSLLGLPWYRDVIDWSRMNIFWTDERSVPNCRSNQLLKQLKIFSITSFSKYREIISEALFSKSVVKVKRCDGTPRSKAAGA